MKEINSDRFKLYLAWKKSIVILLAAKADLRYDRMYFIKIFDIQDGRISTYWIDAHNGEWLMDLETRKPIKFKVFDTLTQENKFDAT